MGSFGSGSSGGVGSNGANFGVSSGGSTDSSSSYNSNQISLDIVQNTLEYYQQDNSLNAHAKKPKSIERRQEMGWQETPFMSMKEKVRGAGGQEFEIFLVAPYGGGGKGGRIGGGKGGAGKTSGSGKNGGANNTLTNQTYTGGSATALNKSVDNVKLLEYKNSGGLWTATKKETSAQNAFRHWNDHGKDFPELQNAKQYVEATKRFVTTPPSGTLVRTRANGDTVYYHPETNTFAVKNADGTPRTMYKPKNGIEYYKQDAIKNP